MLQKLENTYLAILRFVVLAVAGLLLVGVVLLGVNALGLMKQEPVPVKAKPQVSSQEVIAAVTHKDEPTTPTQASAQPTKQADPLKPYYERAAKATAKFVNKVSGGALSIDNSRLIQVLKNNANNLKEPGHEDVYIKGLAEVLEQALTAPTVIQSTPAHDPFSAVGNIVDNYTARFNTQLAEANAKNAEARMQHEALQAQALQSLYYAGGGFGAFLLIVFLSIIIRIERNLRNLERIPAQAKIVQETIQPASQTPELSSSTAS